MAQSGFTPIQLYFSTTAAATPSAGNLANGELAVNITDGKLFYKDNGGVVRVLATTAGSAGDVVGPGSSTDNALVRFDSTTGKLVQNSVGVLDDSGNLTGIAALTTSGALTLSAGTANGVAYLNGSKVLTTGSALTFDGTNFTAPRTQFTTSGSPPASGAGLEILGGTTPLLFAYNRSTSAYLALNQTASAFGWSLSGSDAMILTSTGLGVGTASPAVKLQVNGDSNTEVRIVSSGSLTAGASSLLRFGGSNSATSGYVGFGGFGSTFDIVNALNGPMVFYTNNSEQMRLTSTGLGIGTSSPGTRLDVSGVIRGTFNSSSIGGATTHGFEFRNATTTTKALIGGYDSSTGAYIQAVNFGTAYENLVLQPNGGNLGLGVTPSAWGSNNRAYQVAPTGVAWTPALSYVGGEANFSHNCYHDGTSWRFAGTGFGATRLEAGIQGAFRWFSSGNVSGTAGNAISFTQAMTLDASGNLGVGTTSPSSYGRIVAVSPDNTSTTQLVTAISANLGQSVSMTFGGLRASSGAGLGFAVNGSTTNAASIDSSGNLLVGTTSAIANSRFRVVSGSTSNSDYAFLLTNSAGTALLAITGGGSFSTGTAASSPYNNTTASGANIVVTADGTLSRSTSSLKYKTDVQNTTHGLQEVMQLRAVTYKGKNDGDTVFGGLIAEEVHEAGLTEFVQYAEDGTPDALNYGNMVSLAFKSIQEQQAIITALTARVAALESN